MARGTNSRGPRLLLQHPYKSNTMDEAVRIDDATGGTLAHPEL
jgi:hypothetical protein